MTETLYDLSATLNSGDPLSFDVLRGKVLLIVNTASRCGFTPHYAGLQALHEKYEERGLVVLGFPCDQFGHQEPGTDEEIKGFCSSHYRVTFPLMKKSDVNGPETNPVFRLLKLRAKGILGQAIKWNFTKFLVSPDGSKITRYAPTTTPEAIEKDILALLGETSGPRWSLEHVAKAV